MVAKGPEIAASPPAGGRSGPNRGPGSSAGPPRGGGGPLAGGGNRILERFDRNNDGKVTKEEFGGPPRRFGIVDKDGDGIITREEAEAAPPPPGRGGGEAGARPGPGPGAASVRPQQPREPGDAPAAPEKPARSGSPNIVLILADDMGWTGLSLGMDDRIENCDSDFYQTPRVARLAEQGMRFSQAYSPGSRVGHHSRRLQADQETRCWLAGALQPLHRHLRGERAFTKATGGAGEDEEGTHQAARGNEGPDGYSEPGLRSRCGPPTTTRPGWKETGCKVAGVGAG